MVKFWCENSYGTDETEIDMLNNAKNGSIAYNNTSIDYISFGNGGKNLIMIRGLGEGLRTVKGTALPFSFIYHRLVKLYRVYVFSRPNSLTEGCSTKTMAEDIIAGMDALGIKTASVIGISLGGMIAQQLAINHPERVEKLVLTVTLPRPNETERAVIGRWVELAHAGDYKGIMMDTAANSYSDKYWRRAKPMYSLISSFGRPKSYDRFLKMANACVTHDAYDELPLIKCPTLIIGGKRDKIVTGEASVEMSERIAGSELYMYEEYRHGLYEEAGDFIDRVTAFIEA